MADMHDNNDNNNDQQLTDALKALLARNNGDSGAVAQLLFTDNYQLRETRRQLQSQVRDLTGQVPPEGSLVLSSEDAALWQAYRGLGNPDDLSGLQSTLTTVQNELQTVTRQRLATEAAAALNWNPTVLLDRLPADAVLETRLVANEKGEQVPTPFVTIEDKETKLADYGAQHWKVYLPALQQGKARKSGTPWIPQQGSQPSPDEKPVTAEQRVASKRASGRYVGV